MDLKGLVDKAKAALQKNPSLIDKGGDVVDKVTGGKYAAQVDKAQDAARKAVGTEQNPEPHNPEPHNPEPHNPGTPNPEK